ncbi:hypothetical protein [Microbulbifer thermotolerans]|uniref:Thioredoxin domain-containing protein n=1 Tax=Microbulbifer thermotolerans TaxID=252514 RepID=A0A143HLZ9_MICTH|nr:hypothetical protein [Microbulbifer thermotolerans]AMX02516.1 hypothetical protein A3224_07885 [Microbulbifer thermotolerans]MCX2779372.1 hypothetical protein [Microbulbifer thermotolerans]MCX2782424.1 hypothetical protein [Microbulbifer thermotolerans]MCX2795009.1 hypothetical protein [Microbulbifer thermotolerans]MCX2800577.1 hypothetical protein [Microbulbifer thermotolerans]
MKITLVKKILADGSPCAKCRDVQQKLEENDQLRFIDQTLIADMRDEQSPGLQLARKYNVERAPFFVVEEEGREPQIYTVYFKLVKDVLQKKAEESKLAS